MPAAVLTAQIELNKSGGLGLGLLRKAGSTRLIGAGLEHDFKKSMD